MNPVEALKNELREITDLKGAVALMHWDMETYMPPGGAKARARQVAMLEALAHERFIGEGVSKPLGEMVDLDSGELLNGADDETSNRICGKNVTNHVTCATGLGGSKKKK